MLEWLNVMKLRGKVVRGLGIGKKLGYPTANLEISRDSVSGIPIPETESRPIIPGVYAARATVDSATYDAAVVVGARLEGDRPLIEIYFLDFHGELYGRELEVDVLKKISEIEQIDKEELLKNKIEEDIRKVQLCLRG